jgi:rhodanese-related sulfurtransferase
MNEQSIAPVMPGGELAEHIARGDAFVLDVRSAVHGGQIFGAIRYDPEKLLEAARLMLPLPKGDGVIVLYDEDGRGERAARIAERLRSEGYAPPRLLAGGFATWRSEQRAVEEATLEQPVPLVSEQQLER